jgi:predicted ATPase
MSASSAMPNLQSTISGKVVSKRDLIARVWPGVTVDDGALRVQVAALRRVPAAEACFRDARDVARKQGALFWELRAALSLAHLRMRQNRKADARQVLAPVYDRFTEGFETADLSAARARLESLPPG